MITGASRGIGRAAMAAFARAGYDVIGVARSGTSLEGVCRELRAQGLSAHSRVCDLGDLEAAANLARRLARSETLYGLVLNAGIASNHTLVESTADERMREMSVNYLAPAQLVSTLAPKLGRRSGFIAGVGSLTGLLPFPTNANYAASKAALAHMLRTLRLEADTGLHVGLVLPGYTRTSLAAGYRAPSFLASSPEDIAAALLRCAERRQRVVIPGVLNQLMAGANWIAPQLVDRILRLGVQREERPAEAHQEAV